MKEKKMKDVLESIAQRNVPDTINIWPQIAAKTERHNMMQTARTRPALALLLVLLALAVISSVAYAIGKAAGYIPGVGIVDQSVPLRILAEPVVVEREDLTVTISDVVADSEQTFVAYTLDGIVVPAMSRPTCGALPSIQLPDGSALNIGNVDDGGPQGAEVGSIQKLKQSVTFSAIPAGVSEVIFTLPCILPEGTGPENWQIPLRLSPAPKEYATPVLELSTASTGSNPTSDATQMSAPQGSGLYLNKVIELPDSYILVGHFRDTGDLPGGLVVNLDPGADLPHLEDSQGNAVPLEVRDDIQPETSDQYWARYWAYEITKPVQGPLTMTLDQVNVSVSETTQFSIDVGSAPQAGQKWDLDLPIRLRGYEYGIDSVEVIQDGYLFKYHAGIDVPGSLILNIVGSSPDRQAGEEIRQDAVVSYVERVIYLSSPPTGELTVELTLTETVPHQGPWTLIWMPPSQ
jgi:hypothetical protein